VNQFSLMRNKLENLLHSLHEGEKVIVSKLYTIAASTRHLIELLNRLEVSGDYLQSLKEGIDTRDTVGYSFTYVVKHLSEFQSDGIREQTKKGMVKAKEKGESVGRPRKPDENVQRAIDMYQSKNYSLAEIRKETGINKSTIYRYLES